MFKKITLFFVFLASAMALKADDGQKIASKVQKVIVFLSGAQVTRSALVNVSAGTSTITFENLSPGIDVPSIQVHADGEFTILSVKHELNFLNEQAKKQKHIEELRTTQKEIKDKITFQENLRLIYADQEAMLAKNQVVSGQNSNLDIVKLKQALDFEEEQLTALKKKEQAINNEVAVLNLELAKYDSQVASIIKGNSTATSDILVTVSSKIALQAHFTLSYVAHNAGWFPTYDIRAKDVNSPINISYKANVSQQSGEDWKNIKLTLSTGNPSVSGSKPALNPYYLNIGMYYTDQTRLNTSIGGKIIGSDDGKPIVGASIKIKGTSIGAVSDVNGNFSLEIPPNAQIIQVSYIGYETQERQITGFPLNISLKPSTSTLNEVIVTGYGSTRGDEDGYVSESRGIQRKKDISGALNIPVPISKTENQTNVEFDIQTPYSIPTDGKQYTVEINNLDLNAAYQYSVAPKLSTDVFLTARLTDWNKYNFLAGEANLFFEGTYIGKSLLDTHATADTLSLSLGADKNIVVTRTLRKELSVRQSLGSNKKETKDWQIEIKNRKSQAINLLVEDQVPVSQNSAIEVEVQETSGAKPDQLTGKLSWNFSLNPQDDKKVELKYQVKYPKNETVIVQ